MDEDVGPCGNGPRGEVGQLASCPLLRVATKPEGIAMRVMNQIHLLLDHRLESVFMPAIEADVDTHPKSIDFEHRE